VLLGVVFGYLVTLTGSLWSSVFAHALNNGISTVLYFAYGPGASAEPAPDDPRQALLLSMGAGLVVLGFLTWLRSVTPAEPPPPTEDLEARTSPPQLAETYRSALTWAFTALLTLAGLGLAARVLNP
jgi:uncharacterized protein